MVYLYIYYMFISISYYVVALQALCLGVVGGSRGLGFGEPDGLWAANQKSFSDGRPWFLLEEVEGVEYLHARGKKFQDIVFFHSSKLFIDLFVYLFVYSLTCICI